MSTTVYPKPVVDTAIAALGVPKLIDNIAALLADTTLDYAMQLDLELESVPPSQSSDPVVAAGSYVQTRSEGFSYLVAASNATDHHIATAGGVKLYALGDTANLKQFGCVGDGTADDTAQITKAVASGKNVELPDGGTYRLTTGVSLSAGQKVYSKNGGKILYAPSGSYTSAILLHDNCTVEGVTFIGTGLSKAHADIYEGAAIGANNRSNLTVKDCRFESFVFSTETTSIIAFQNTRSVTVADNFFATSNYTGHAISFANRVGDAIVRGNKCYANVDLFLSVATTGQDYIAGSLVHRISHHIVSGNIVNPNNGQDAPVLARHGISVHYAGGFSYATITGNIILNCERHGIYLRGSNSPLVDPTGPNIVSNNIIRFCGGEGGGSSPYSVNSGIKVECSLPTVISDNIIEDSGYAIDGTIRTYATAGIEIARLASNLRISGNRISRVRGGGITVSPTVVAPVGVFNADMIQIEGNSVLGATVQGILIGTNTNPTVTEIGAFSIVNNTVELLASTAYGIGITAVSSVAGARGRISGNMVRGSAASDGKIGIAVQAQKVNATITENTIERCGIGMKTGNVDTSGTVGTNFLLHRYVGENVWIDNNLFLDCTDCYSFDGNGARIMSFVGPNNRYENVTTSVFGTAAWGRPLAAVRLGVNSAGAEQFEFSADSIPLAGQSFVAGDRIRVRSPAAGAPKQFVCTTGGDPGTWTPDILPSADSFAVDRRIGNPAARDIFAATLSIVDAWKFDWFNTDTKKVEMWSGLNFIETSLLPAGWDLCTQTWATLLSATGIVFTDGSSDINGGTTSGLATTTTANNHHSATTLIGANTNIITCIAKAGTTNFLALSTSGGSLRMGTFNLTTGTIVRQVAGTARITHLHDGWYFCEYSPNDPATQERWSMAISDVEAQLYLNHVTPVLTVFVSTAKRNGVCI